jgi:ribosomal protein L20A (L18A)
MQFEIKGKIKSRELEFKKILDAENEKMVREKFYSLIGSKQRVPRRDIEIIKMEEKK